MKRGAHILLLGLLQALAGCDSQASPDYVGKPLITLRGSVEIEQTPKGQQLKPALAFFNGETGMVHIVDVVVEGEFPSDFTLRVMAPPPDAAFFAGPAGISSALGYITAVTAGHPDELRYATRSEREAYCYEDEEGRNVCDGQSWWCSGGGDDPECYGESQHCVNGAGPNKCEIVEAVGDPRLKDTWANFAGLSEDLVLVYLSEPLEAGDEDAIRLGLPGLAAGYAVLEPQPGHDGDSEDGVACDDQIQERAAELHAEAYDTGVTYEYLLAQGSCGGVDVGDDEWIPCDPRADLIWQQINEEFTDVAAAEIGCRATGSWRIVDDSEREHIAIKIGTGVQPTLYSPDRYNHTQDFAPSLMFDGSGGLKPFDPCGEVEIVKVGWDEQSPTGATPEEAFAAMEAGCTTTLTWGDEYGERVVSPSSGTTELVVEVALDRDSARYERYPNALQPRCANREQLKIDAQLTLRSADGAIDDTSTATLADGVYLFVKRPIAEHGGTLQVAHDEDEADQLFVSYALSGAGESCVGSVGYYEQTEVFPDGSVGGTGGAIGSWSNNGCDLGATRVSLDEPIAALGESPRAMVERIFGELELTGRWSDEDSDTQVQISVELGDGTVCLNDGIIPELPVAIRYATSDGVIAEHVASFGQVTLNWRKPGKLEADLYFLDSQECSGPDASLPITTADCAHQHGVTVQLQLRHDGEELEAVQGLAVYHFDRGGFLDRMGEGMEFESADGRRSMKLK